MIQFKEMLSGGELRSIRQSGVVVSKITTQNDFDELIHFLFHNNRLIVMRAADAIEKVTIKSPQYLYKHQVEIFELCNTVKEKELKWHLALLLPRLNLSEREFGTAWHTLSKWAFDKTNSRLVRVNAVRALSQLLLQKNELIDEFKLTLREVEKENIPSINSRIRLIRKQLGAIVK
jgi:hypothetical protein